jgi:hypothetical protein
MRLPGGKSGLAGGLFVFLLVGGAAGLAYRYVNGKVKQVESLGQRLSDLAVDKADVESLVRSMRKRIERLEADGQSSDDGDDDDDVTMPDEGDEGEGDGDDDEITFIKPRAAKRTKGVDGA